jgi:glycosyltransferase involved in cell wall biosynthesis
MGELIDHGTTGFLVDDLDSAVDAIALAGDVDRAAIRAATVAEFDVATMVDRYVAVYRTMLGHTSSRA